jgi:hypothetical protein
MNRLSTYSILLPLASAAGILLGNAYHSSDLGLSGCGVTIAHASVPCYHNDACNDPQLNCRSVGAGWWEVISPAGKKLWQSGLPKITLNCERALFINANCTGIPTGADFQSDTCNHPTDPPP